MLALLQDKAFLATVTAIVGLVGLIYKTWGKEAAATPRPPPSAPGVPVVDKVDATIVKLDAVIIAQSNLQRTLTRIEDQVTWLHEQTRDEQVRRDAVRDYVAHREARPKE